MIDGDDGAAATKQKTRREMKLSCWAKAGLGDQEQIEAPIWGYARKTA